MAFLTSISVSKFCFQHEAACVVHWKEPGSPQEEFYKLFLPQTLHYLNASITTYHKQNWSWAGEFAKSHYKEDKDNYPLLNQLSNYVSVGL